MLAERIGETLSGEVAPFFVSVFGSGPRHRRPGGGADRRGAAQLAAAAATVQLEVPPRQPELQVQLRAGAAGCSTDCRPRMCCRRSTPRTTAPSRAQLDAVRPQRTGRRAHRRRRPYTRGCRRAALRGRDGTLVPLSAVAKITMVSARSLVEHEDGLRRQVVVASPTTRRPGRLRARRASRRSPRRCRLPPSVYLRYGGAARRRRRPRTSCCGIRRPHSC